MADHSKTDSRYADVPDQRDAPVVWDAERRRFVEVADGQEEAVAKEEPRAPGPALERDERRFFVGADVASTTPPVRERTAQPLPRPRPSGPGKPPPRDPAAAPAARPWFRRVRWKWVAVVAVVLPVLLLAAGFVWAQRTFSRIEKVPVGELLDHGGPGTNYLIVGSDSRSGIDPNDPNAGAFLGDGAPDGQRSDTILVLHVDGANSKMLSIPRDLYVTIAETGSQSRINSAYNGGPSRLIQTVQQSLGIRVNRYLEVDFVTFAGLVDAIGGVTINFPHPAFDDHTGLNVQQSGDVELNGSQALAYVRSRYYTEVIDGENHPDPTGDLGRIARQQVFLRTVLGKAGKSKNPLTLMRIASAVSKGIRIDDRMSMLEAFKLAWRMGKLNPESVVLPVTPFRTSGGAAVLKLADGSDEVLALFK